MNSNYLAKGSYNVVCDQCGQKYKSHQCKLQWDGLFTCFNCFDPKHPWLEPLPIPIDALPVPLARPRPQDINETPVYEDMGIWGVRYKMMNGDYVTDTTWGGWTGYWGGNSNVPYTPTNFPLQ